MDPSTHSTPSPLAPTRRTFIRGIAAAGASTAAAASLSKGGLLSPAGAQAHGPAGARNAFSDFRALAPSARDLFEVPEGYRADVLIGWGDAFLDEDGNTLRYGFNCDYLAYFPLRGDDEGLIFVNHEYPSPFFQHGNTDGASKTRAQVEIEQESVGNSVVHIKRGKDDVWRVVSPSRFNRRITAHTSPHAFTGPLADNPAYPGIGSDAPGSLANCSGGITPWGTALSCEENYQDYGSTSGYGWVRPVLDTDVYVNGDGSSESRPAKFGWVCEHDPYDPSFVGRKHTALGRFRHENTAFRARPGKPFVLYMGDDRNDGGVYKFVSELPYRPGRRSENLRILERGKLYVACWEPDGRRRFDAAGNLVTATEGTGWWREVTEDELVDTHVRIARNVGAAAWTQHYATNRPEDVEVAEDGSVWIALTNNSSVNDVHGSIRRFVENRNDASAVGPDAPFEWEDYAAGGPSGSEVGSGEEGFSSPDNLVFDRAGNLWIVTDISSGTLNDPTRPQAFHANNAVFMIPAGQEAGEATAFRFANMPVQSEGTGPYFTPDEQTLFVNVQHPGENSSGDPSSTASYTSYWPRGEKTAERDPSKPIPATVAITKVRRGKDAGSRFVPPPVPPRDTTPPELSLAVASQLRMDAFLRLGLKVRVGVDEPARVEGTLAATVRWGWGSRRVTLDGGRINVEGPDEVSVTLHARGADRLLLRLARRADLTLDVRATDRAGNVTRESAKVALR